MARIQDKSSTGKKQCANIILTPSIAKTNMNHTNRNDTQMIACKDLELGRVENSDSYITKDDSIGTEY